MDTEDLSFKINRHDIKIRKNFGSLHPATKVEPTKKKKREKDNVRRQIKQDMQEDD